MIEQSAPPRDLGSLAAMLGGETIWDAIGGLIEDAIFIPQRLPDATLQALTA